MSEIKLSSGKTVKLSCLSCSIVNGEHAVDGGVILETEYFHAHQDVAYPVKGLVILASKRHVKCLDELNEEERLDCIETLSRIRKAQRKALGIGHVYYFYNEDTKHHFHTWMVPRYEWMRKFGTSIESVRPSLLYARENMNSEAHMEEILRAINKLREELAKG